jgi:hypothetical protein
MLFYKENQLIKSNSSNQLASARRSREIERRDRWKGWRLTRAASTMLTLAAILMLGIGVSAKEACDGVAFLPRELFKTGAKDVAQSGD